MLSSVRKEWYRWSVKHFPLAPIMWKLNINRVSKNPRAWQFSPKVVHESVSVCWLSLRSTTTFFTTMACRLQIHRHCCIVVICVEWNMRDLSVALKNHEKFSKPHAFWRYCDESCAFQERSKSPISFQHTSRWTLLHSKMFHPNRIHQW